MMKHVEFSMDLEIKRDIQREANKGHNVTHVLYTGEQSDSILESNDPSTYLTNSFTEGWKTGIKRNIRIYGTSSVQLTVR